MKWLVLLGLTEDFRFGKGRSGAREALDQVLVLGEEFGEFGTLGQLKVFEIEPWGYRAAYQSKGFGVLKAGSEPASGFDDRLKDFSGFEIVPYVNLRITAVFGDYVYE